MASPFVGQIITVGFNFAPYGWAQCQGQLLPISQNTALFSLLGTYYGGDGRSNFALPDLTGRIPVGQGQLTGGGIYDIGSSAGSPSVTLLASELPSHTHSLVANVNDPPNSTTPVDSALNSNASVYTSATAPVAPMNANAIVPAGNNTPHNNMMPYLVLNFCIALQGVFPPRG